MVKALLPSLVVLLGCQTLSAQVTGSVYTDLNAECKLVESSEWEKNPEIDHSRSVCKGYGGYGLEISGGDLRYAPRLFWNRALIEIEYPGAFHDMGSTKVEWLYEKDRAGNLSWVGFIYRLKVSTPEGDRSLSKLYAVRLDEGRTCSLGEVPGANNQLAREMILTSKSGCR